MKETILNLCETCKHPKNFHDSFGRCTVFNGSSHCTCFKFVENGFTETVDWQIYQHFEIPIGSRSFNFFQSNIKTNWYYPNAADPYHHFSVDKIVITCFDFMRLGAGSIKLTIAVGCKSYFEGYLLPFKFSRDSFRIAFKNPIQIPKGLYFTMFLDRPEDIFPDRISGSIFLDCQINRPIC